MSDKLHIIEEGKNTVCLECGREIKAHEPEEWIACRLAMESKLVKQHTEHLAKMTGKTGLKR